MPLVRRQPSPALCYAASGLAVCGVCALATCLALHPTRATERRADGNGNKIQTSAPGRKPTASARPKHTENSSAFSGATPWAPRSETTASSRRPQPPIEIGRATAPVMTTNKTIASGSGSARPCARPSDQTTTMVNASMRHAMPTTTGPLDPKTTRWTSAANVANQREYRHRASGETIFGASKRPSAPARINAPYTMSTTSRYPPSAVRPDGSNSTTNPSTISRPTPTPRSITTLVTAVRQLLPSRTSSQARTPSPATLGKTWAKNTPTAVAATRAIRVICLSRAASASTILYQRRPASGISSVATKIASAAQRKSSSGIVDKTWRQSICRETYQKHAPVTSSLAATITAFLTPPRCDGRGVSKSLATLVLIRLRL